MKKSYLFILTLLAIALASCEEEEGCTTVCGSNEVLTADCNCVTLITDPCADVNCPAGFVCANGDCIEEASTTVTKAGLLATDETWTADKEYILQGKVVVSDGVTLTIEAGTIIKGATGTGSLASALVVARGGKLMAEGTAEKPIIMTTIKDNIQIGETFGTNLDETAVGEWGGLIVLGRAPISARSGAEAQIEGIPADDSYGAYGGDNVDDNSGVIKYMSVRHGGALIGDGNEINGITLGGVGAGTVIENVEVVANFDDGIEFFGGSVSVKNALVWAQGDDAYDIDQAWSGTVDNFIYIAGNDSDHALEIDGPENDINSAGSFTLTNGHLIGLVGEYGDWRDGAQGTLVNSYFTNFPEGADMELDGGGKVTANYAAGKIVISGNEFNLPGGVELSSIFKDTDDAGDDAKFKADMTASNAAVTERTVGADPADFAWTFASAKGKL